MSEDTTIQQIRDLVSNTEIPFDTRIARIARLVEPLIVGTTVPVTATLIGAYEQLPATEVVPDNDGDVRVKVRIGDWSDVLYVPASEVRR